MSRAAYSDDIENDWQLVMWRGAVRSAIRGKRGQRFLCDLVAALETLSDKRLIAGSMVRDDCVCAIGAVGKARGVDMTEIDRLITEENEDEGCWGQAIGKTVAAEFGIADALAREIMFINDEGGQWDETGERRYQRVLNWAKRQIVNGERQ